MDKFQLIPLEPIQSEQARKTAARLNGFCSLFYFTKFILQKNRLQEYLHKDWCEILEKRNLKELIEIPRDHFKTTLASEAFPIWRALRVQKSDEDMLSRLGYSDDYIDYIKFIHNPNLRILIVSEVEKNAQKIGSKIDYHYKNNTRFRATYPDVIPTPDCPWNAGLKTHRRDQGHNHGEGTYNFLGVGSALQSNHFDIIIQDDLVGRDQAEGKETSVSVDQGIQYHKLLLGAFDNQISGPDTLNDEIIIGNRWSEYDFNSWVRDNEPDFHIESHSADGGCCDKHPEGEPILPSEFSIEKLNYYKRRQGPYIYSCQFRNKPVNDETRIFKDEWARYYKFKKTRGSILIEHEIAHGEVFPDVSVNTLQRYMVVDPNHAGAAGRCRHAITITGIDSLTHKNNESDDDLNFKYLLDEWAGSEDIKDFIDAIYFYADKWKLNEIYLETIGAQTYLKYHLEDQNKNQGSNKRRLLKINSLHTSHARDAKKQRIGALVPFFFRHEFWCRRDQTKFLSEFESYPNGKYVDILDTLGYSPQVWDTFTQNDNLDEAVETSQEVTKSFGLAGY